jgi:hypothetical protein
MHTDPSSDLGRDLARALEATRSALHSLDAAGAARARAEALLTAPREADRA